MTISLKTAPHRNASDSTAWDAKMQAQDNTHHIQGIVKKRTEENFPVSPLIFPKEVRHGLLAFYQFARGADDIADDGSIDGITRLQRLQQVEAFLEQDDAEFVPGWLLPYALMLRNDEVPAIHGQNLLHAFKQDCTKTRYHNWSELLDYCQHSAAPVGRVVLHLHGEVNANIAAADALCTVLQLINHLQDLKSDFTQRDRVYFPLEWLNGKVEDLGDDASSPRVEQMKHRALDKVDELLTAASHLPTRLMRRRLTLEMIYILAIAQVLVEKLRVQDPLATRVVLSTKEKLTLMGKSLWRYRMLNKQTT